MKALASYIMRGPWQAVGVVGLCGALGWLLPPLGLLSAAALALVTLCNGLRDGLVVMLGATALVGVIAVGGLGAAMPAVGQVVVSWLPVALTAAVLSWARAQGLMLIAAGVLAGLLALAVRISMGDVDAWWRELGGKITKEAALIAPGAIPAGFLDAVAPYLNGLAAASVMLNLVLSVLLARWWQSLLHNQGGFRSEFHALRLPAFMAWVFLLNALIIAVSQPAGAYAGFPVDVFVLAMMLYVFQGLALVHSHCAHGGSLLWLATVYGGLLVIAPPMVLLLSAVGLIDSVLDLRRLDRKIM